MIFCAWPVAGWGVTRLDSEFAGSAREVPRRRTSASTPPRRGKREPKGPPRCAACSGPTLCAATSPDCKPHTCAHAPWLRCPTRAASFFVRRPSHRHGQRFVHTARCASGSVAGLSLHGPGGGSHERPAHTPRAGPSRPGSFACVRGCRCAPASSRTAPAAGCRDTPCRPPVA